tara:strand:+ start:741 stop:977 length:237 start_codon:yes stop_codon:yes gene_type:complete
MKIVTFENDEQDVEFVVVLLLLSLKDKPLPIKELGLILASRISEGLRNGEMDAKKMIDSDHTIPAFHEELEKWASEKN